MRVLATIAGWRLQNLHLLMTSRGEQEIKGFLEDYVDERVIIDLERDVVSVYQFDEPTQNIKTFLASIQTARRTG